MNETLDDDLRTMMRTAVTRTPEPPGLEALLLASGEHHDTPRRWRPMAFSAACMMAGVMGALLLWPDAPRSVRPAVDQPADIDGVIDHLLPRDLADGLRIIDISVDRGRPAGLQTYVFEDARSSRANRAVLTVQDALPDGLAEGLDSSLWDGGISTLSWRLGDRRLMLIVGDGAFSTAKDLAAGILIDETETGPQARLSSDVQGWRQAAVYLAEGEGPGWQARIRMASSDGQDIVVRYEPATSIPPVALLLYPPAATDGIVLDVRMSPPDLVSTRDGVVVTAWAYPRITDRSIVERAVRSMSPSSTDEWDRLRSEIIDDMIASPVSESWIVGPYRITNHDTPPFFGTCIATASARGCETPQSLSADIIDSGGKYTGTTLSLDDGTWVSVGTWPANEDLPECEPSTVRFDSTQVGPSLLVVATPADMAESFFCSASEGGFFGGGPPLG